MGARSGQRRAGEVVLVDDSNVGMTVDVEDIACERGSGSSGLTNQFAYRKFALVPAHNSGGGGGRLMEMDVQTQQGLTRSSRVGTRRRDQGHGHTGRAHKCIGE